MIEGDFSNFYGFEQDPEGGIFSNYFFEVLEYGHMVNSSRTEKRHGAQFVKKCYILYYMLYICSATLCRGTYETITKGVIVLELCEAKAPGS